MEVATLVATLKAEIAAFERAMATADSVLTQVRGQIRETERTAVDLDAALNSVKMDTRQATETSAVLDSMKRSLGQTSVVAFATDDALSKVKVTSAQAAETTAATGIMARDLAHVRDEALAAKAAMGDLGGAGGVGVAGGRRGVGLPGGSASEFQRGGILGWLLGDQTARTVASGVERSAQSGGGGGGNFLGGLAAGMGFGGGKGIFIPGLGFGFGRRAFGGAATLGSIGGLLGFGAERAVTSTLGIAGSLGGGLLGGGLLASGVLGTAAVGMGTDLAGIGQAAGDIKTVSHDLGALQAAIRTYGRNSQQAAQAQAQLNQDLGGFSPVAKNAVLAAAQTSQGFKKMFDQVTGLAERTGAEIINQAMRTGEKFLPTLGHFAFQNLQIIQHGLQPFFAWLQNSGKGGGLGIFTNLEQIFQSRLPTMVHAGTQAFELFVRVIDVAAQQTGNLAGAIDHFFTKWNSPANFPRVANEVNKLIGLFRTWMGLLGSATGLVVDLFKPAVGLGAQFATSLTQIINKVRAWITETGTQNVLHSLFAAHMQQVKELGLLIQALLPLLTSVISAFLQIEAAFASAFNNGLKPIIDALKWLLSNSIVTWALGWAGAMFLVARATSAIGAGFSVLIGGDILAGLRGIALGFFGIQTAAVKAQIATDAETASIATMDAAAGEQLALFGGAAGSAGLLGGLKGGIGRAGLFAGGGFLLGGLAKNVIGGRAGSVAQGALTGAGIGAGVGSVVPGIGTGVGAGIGALAGTVFALAHSMPSLDQQLNKLGATFVLLAAHAQRAGAALGQSQQKFATGLQQVAKQAQTGIVFVGGFAREASMLSTATQTSSQRLAAYVGHLTDLANSAQKSDPKLAKVYRDLVQIAEGVHKIPSKKTVTIFLHTIATGGLGPAGMIGGGDLFAYGLGAHQPAPKINLNLPSALALQLAKAQAGHGSIQKADAAAYAYYEALLKKHNLTRKQIMEIYTAEAQYAPYQIPGHVPHATGSLTGATTGTALLPASIQNMLSRAQQRAGAANVTSVGQMTPAQLQRALAANKRLHDAEAAAIADLVRRASQVNASSKQHLALEQEITTLTREQAASQRAITADLKQQHALAVQGHINRILGIRGGGAASGATGIQQRERNMFIRALEQALGGSHHTIGATAQALGITVGQLTRESPQQLLRQMRQNGITLDAKSMAELRKIQEAIKIAHKENVKLTPVETRKITNWLQQIQQELTGTSTIKSNYIAPSARDLTAGLGLTPKQRAEEIGRLSSYYMHGHRVPTGGAAAGVPLPSGVGGGVQLPAHHHHHHSAPITIKIEGAHKDGAQLAREIRAELLKIQRRNGAQTRGPNAGKGVGLA